MANVFQVKAKLSEYLDRAAKGERVVICRHNKPIAELRAIEATRSAPRPVGPIKGRPTFEIPSIFFDPLPDAELEAWEAVVPMGPQSVLPTKKSKRPAGRRPAVRRHRRT